MKKLIEDKGWKFFFDCHCGGSLREHYQNSYYPTYEIRIRPTRHTFTILVQGMVIAGPDHGYLLESKMKELELW